MKKVIALIVCTATLLSLLCGCGAEAKPSGSGISGEEVLAAFEEKLAPLADQFQTTRQPRAELEDGEICLPVVITDPLLERSYHLRLYCSPEGEATSAMLNADRGTRTELNFAILSLYLYESLGLPDIDADSFYEDFSLLTEEPSGSMSAEGWNLAVIALDTFFTFSATYSAE